MMLVQDIALSRPIGALAYSKKCSRCEQGRGKMSSFEFISVRQSSRNDRKDWPWHSGQSVGKQSGPKHIGMVRIRLDSHCNENDIQMERIVVSKDWDVSYMLSAAHELKFSSQTHKSVACHGRQC